MAVLAAPALRAMAAAVAISALLSLCVQFVVTTALVVGQGRSVLDGLVLLTGYFTILTNSLVAVSMGCIALGRWPFGTWRPLSVLTAITLYIIVVCLVYHFLLADIWQPKGWALVADMGLHYVVPVMMCVFWVLFVPKAGLDWTDPARWLVYPLGYCLYALVRGAFTGWYPYPFLDAGIIGLGRVLFNSTMLCIGFWALGLGLVRFSRFTRG